MAEATQPAGVPASGTPAPAATANVPDPVAAGLWRASWRAIKSSWAGRLSLLTLVLIVASSLAAPLWANHVADSGPLTNHLTDQIRLNGELTDVVSFEGIPIGPTGQKRFFLGADANGRDIMVRLLYGGRNSLQISLVATTITLLLGTLFGLIAGFFRGWVDSVISRGLDILQSTPIILLGIALGVATALGGINLGIVKIPGDSLFIPALIIGVIQTVYVARPLRGITLSLRERPFVEAARSQGATNMRIIRREILPNLGTSLLVLAPIIFAQTVSYEAALSFLGAGVQPPNPSWGTLISDGLDVLVSAPHLTIIPGAVLAAMVLSLNLLGDVVREAIDPRGMVAAAQKDEH
ncbi:MAG: ABC transporter permease [Solirubrobacteraceae bacterium]|nr:ABC transporter permease [Solirubrobacteraceae bacterium]